MSFTAETTTLFLLHCFFDAVAAMPSNYFHKAADTHGITIRSRNTGKLCSEDIDTIEIKIKHMQNIVYIKNIHEKYIHIIAIKIVHYFPFFR